MKIRISDDEVWIIEWQKLGVCILMAAVGIAWIVAWAVVWIVLVWRVGVVLPSIVEITENFLLK